MSKSRFVACLTLACVVSPLSAAPTAIVTLANVAERVRSENPGLAAARLRVAEALGRMRQAGRPANPQLETSLGHDARFREGAVEVGISQLFPVTGRLALEKEISLTEWKAAEAEVREVERQLVGSAREAIVKILATRERRLLLERQSKLSQEFAALLADSSAKGETSVLDAGQAKLESLSLATEMRQLDAGEAGLVGTLKPLLGMQPGEALSVSGALPDAVLPAQAVDPGRRPDFQAARLEAQAASQEVALEQAKRYGDVEGGLFASANRMEDAPRGLETEAMIGLRLKFPLPLFNRNEGAIEEARAKMTRKDLEGQALGRGIRLEAETARSEMRQWARLIAEIDESLLPLAIQQVELADEAYRNAQGEITALLRAREKRLQISAARIDALREFHLARVRHDTALAQP